MSLLRLQNIGHAYLGRTILSEITLDVRAGEIVALVGPSGSGKSTLAHIAAGLVEAKEGRIARGYLRHGMIFQDPALLPWATARGNIDYVLRLAGLPQKERTRRIAQAAAQVALEPEDLDKFPVELSGGMRQRVAIARALAIDPDFLFFDEPFTALDVALRRRMQDVLIETCAGGQRAGLFITHDLQEAARISHRIAVLDARGDGILGERLLPDTPGHRGDAEIFTWVQDVLRSDPIFRHIHDVDERQIA